MEDRDASLKALQVVGVHRGLHIAAPQAALAVVVVGQHADPGVFVDIEPAFAIDMAFTGFEGGLQHPDTV
ncbi:hypothetical protein D3C76_1601080 [compost metagenome]